MPTTLNRAEVAIRLIDANSTRAELIEALGHLTYDAGRVMVTDPRHARLHAIINQLLDLLETSAARPTVVRERPQPCVGDAARAPETATPPTFKV